jgi:hypothetical protein
MAAESTGVVPSRSPWTRALAAPGLLQIVLLLIAAAYARTLLFDFVYDDHALIELSPWMGSWHYVLVVFRKSFWGFDEWQRTAHYYRPMVTALLISVRQLAGPLPAWFHIVVVAAHLGATYLTFALVRRMLQRTDVAILSAAIFGLHPTKVESVAWISGVSDSLALVFTLGAALLYLKARDTALLRWRLCSALLLLAGVLSKEVVIFGVIAFAVYEYSIEAGSFAKRLPRIVNMFWPHGIAILIALLARACVLHATTPPETAANLPLLTLYSAPAATVWYLAHQILPLHVSVQYPLLIVRSFSWTQSALPLLLLVVITRVIWWRVRDSAAGRFFFAWAVLMMAPVIAFHVTVQLHDRYSYIPSIATSVGAAYVLCRATDRHPRARSIVTALLLAVLTVSTYHQAQYWQDDVTLFEHAVQVGRDHPDAYAGLVTAYADHGQSQQQLAAIERWIANTPNSPYRGWYAMFLYQLGQHDVVAAREAFAKAQPGLTQTRVNMGLGALAMAEGLCVDAERYYRATVNAHPEVVELRTKLAASLGCQGRRKEALEELKDTWKLRDAAVE